MTGTLYAFAYAMDIGADVVEMDAVTLVVLVFRNGI
jgi:hypothetical protein